MKKIIWGIVIAVIIALGVFAYYFLTHGYKTCCGPSSGPVTIMVPENLPAYEKAINEYVINGGANPSKTWKFIKKTIIATSTGDIYRTSAEAASRLISSQANGLKEQIHYFKVVDSTAYVLLEMDVDGWAGVSFSIAKIHPLVENTLLQFPEIKTVKFQRAPEDTQATIYQPELLTYSGLTTQNQSKFSIQYPTNWVYFKYSCNTDGLAFWPKSSAPIFPRGNHCPQNLINSAPITVATENRVEVMVSDKNYQEIARTFVITQ